MEEGAIKAIAELARKTVAVSLMRDLPDGRTNLYVVDGTLKEFAMPPPMRQHRVNSLEALICFAKDHASDGNKQSIWYGPAGVELLLDDDDRRDSVWFDLSWWPAYAVLLDLQANRSAFDQRAFLRLLRVDLGVNQEIVAPFRRLDWNKSQQTVGEADLPEQIRIETPVYRQHGEAWTYSIRCLVEPDTMAQRFFLIPIPGELDQALFCAQTTIDERLRKALDDGAQIYFGTVTP